MYVDTLIKKMLKPLIFGFAMKPGSAYPIAKGPFPVIKIKGTQGCLFNTSNKRKQELTLLQA
jgi:hypothetical protein